MKMDCFYNIQYLIIIQLYSKSLRISFKFETYFLKTLAPLSVIVTTFKGRQENFFLVIT